MKMKTIFSIIRSTLLLSLPLFFLMTGAEKAHAVSYAFAVPGGVITTEVSLQGVAPYVYQKNANFDGLVEIRSTSPMAEDVNFNYGQNATPGTMLVPTTSISSDTSTWIGYPTPLHTTPMTATTSCIPNCKVSFQTGIDYNPGIYVKVIEEGYQTGFVSLPIQYAPQWQCGYWSSQNGNSVYLLDYPYVHTQYRAEFYSDPGATIPLDVTGLNFKLKQLYYYDIPTWISATQGSGVGYTGILSGTSYDYDGYSYDYGYTNGYGNSSCDQQGHWYGFETMEGGAAPVPYTLIPQPPNVYFSGPAAVYTNQSATLTWDSQYATSCTGSGFPTGGATSGTHDVTINGTATFTVTCQNITGSSSKSLTVGDMGPFNPPQTCNAYPGNAVYCDPPAYCEADPSHMGFEVCHP